jgi:protease PrsW
MLIPLIAVSGALVPTLFYVAFVWWLDRYEKEPVWLLSLSFLWGAIPAAIVSVFTELFFDASIATMGGGSIVADLASVSVSAPIVEESAKGIALIGLVLLFRHEFDDVLDGIVYGAMIGFGFAFSENLFAYFLPILTQEGLSAGLTNIFLRTVVFGFNHAFWTGITGAAVGYARLAPDWGRRMLAPVGGWTLAVFLHGLHNAGATLASHTLCLSLGVSLGVHWGGLLLLLAAAYFAWRRESRWIERGLVDEVRHGILSAEEFSLLSSAGQRQQAQWRAWSHGGHTAYRAVGRYYQCATELAFKKQHLRSSGNGGGMLEEIGRLQQALVESRDLARPWLRLSSI